MEEQFKSDLPMIPIEEQYPSKITQWENIRGIAGTLTVFFLFWFFGGVLKGSLLDFMSLTCAFLGVWSSIVFLLTFKECRKIRFDLYREAVERFPNLSFEEIAVVYHIKYDTAERDYELHEKYGIRKGLPALSNDSSDENSVISKSEGVINDDAEPTEIGEISEQLEKVLGAITDFDMHDEVNTLINAIKAADKKGLLSDGEGKVLMETYVSNLVASLKAYTELGTEKPEGYDSLFKLVRSVRRTIEDLTSSDYNQREQVFAESVNYLLESFQSSSFQREE